MISKIDIILKKKIIAIIRGISPDKIINTVQALKDGGITCVEVTFNSNNKGVSMDTLKSISMLKKYFGDEITVGAGTVLTEDEVRDAAKAGAEYIISPNTVEKVIRTTKDLGLVSIPGATTPSEIVNAYDMGADIVKLFPAATLGLEYVKAIMSPINHIPLTAVGGINSKNAESFIKAGCVGVGVGGNLVNKELIKSGDFEGIKRLAMEYKL